MIQSSLVFTRFRSQRGTSESFASASCAYACVYIRFHSGVSKTQTSKTQTSDLKNSDPRVSRKLRPRKNSDPRVSRKLRPEKLRPLDVSKTQTRKTQTLWVSRKLRPEK